MSELDDFMRWGAEVSNGKHPEARDIYGNIIGMSNSFPYGTISYWVSTYRQNHQ